MMQWITLLADSDADEIQLVSNICVRLLKRGRPDVLLESAFTDSEQSIVAVQDFAWERSARLDALSPEAGGVTESGVRWHAMIPPLHDGGGLLVLRKQRFHHLSLSSFKDPNQVLQKILEAWKRGRNLLIVGATGCGKSSFMMALMKAEARACRLTVFESVRELPNLSPCWNFLNIGSDWRATLAASLRISPGRILLGEIRMSEAPLFYEAARLGHKGCAATIHGGSGRDAILRLRTHIGQHDDSLTVDVVEMALQGSEPVIQAFICDQKLCG